ncbi:MAG TPA: helix-turn-helix domain-containing protein [Candidatus Levilactobacillus faecigallinarum]|uniref:Helix-turn-helix domain-containing protein n=1 Tax=Candidatus Levilactobacillus faecigallinarum TaxID=2838638 RepID=A0A9D1QTH5_9LACO|nr:helix-turn-helix domain-containing protein [Candidatus Levilactobacillus faecigallinarum]
MKLLENIQSVAKSRNVSITEIERSCSLGANSIYNWNHHYPSIDKVALVAKFLNVRIDSLLTTDKTFSDRIGESLTDQLTIDVIRQMDILNDAHKQRIFAYSQAQIENQARNNKD